MLFMTDYEVVKATYGPPPAGLPPMYGTAALRRLGSIQRNDVENVPLFCAVSAAYVYTNPPLVEARVLLLVYVASR